MSEQGALVERLRHAAQGIDPMLDGEGLISLLTEAADVLSVATVPRTEDCERPASCDWRDPASWCEPCRKRIRSAVAAGRMSPPRDYTNL